jgi:hypothetical protein
VRALASVFGLMLLSFAVALTHGVNGWIGP